MQNIHFVQASKLRLAHEMTWLSAAANVGIQPSQIHSNLPGPVEGPRNRLHRTGGHH